MAAGGVRAKVAVVQFSNDVRVEQVWGRGGEGKEGGGKCEAV